MKIVQGETLEWQRALQHRGGGFHYRMLLKGEPGSIDNYHFGAGRMSGSFKSPRHRHNFEQLRFQLDGESDFGRDGKLKKGMIGYFPEGTFYGPQSQDDGEAAINITLQFGGASGSGFISIDEIKAGEKVLESEGTFGGGVFRRHKDVPGKRSTDSYQAIWEYMNKRPMKYPKPRYSRPFMMDPASYEWVAVDGVPGVWDKMLGIFTERRASIALVRIDSGSRYQAKGRSIYFVTSGKGTVGREPLQHFTAFHLDKGETVTVAAAETVEMVHYGLPDLSHLLENHGSSVAAE